MDVKQLVKDLRCSSLMFFIFLMMGPGKLAIAAESVVAPKMTLKSGTLIVATYFDNPPFEFMEDNKQVGFEVDLIREIARRLHLKVEFKNNEWETIISKLNNNQYDLIMGAITVTPQREKIIAFTKPYMTTSLSLIINPDKTPYLLKINDLHDSIVGVQATTTDYDIAVTMKKRKQIKEIKIYPFHDFVKAINELCDGRIGAVMKIFPVAFYYVQHNPDLKILSAVPDDPQPLGFGINQNNKELLNAINKTQAQMQADGGYNKIFQRWFGS